MSIVQYVRDVSDILRRVLYSAFGGAGIELQPISPQPKECLATHLGEIPAETMQELAALFSTGRYVELATCVRALLGQFPNSAFAWQALGLAQLLQGEHPLDALGRAAELAPNDVQVLQNLAAAQMAKERLHEAVASYTRILALKPESAEAHRNLACALKALGRLDAAADSFRLALKLNPSLTEAHNGLANAYREMGLLDDAVSLFRRSLELVPDSAEVHTDLGLALQDLGQLDLAQTSYLTALELTSGSVSKISQRVSSVYAKYLYEHGSQEEAVYYYQQAFLERTGWTVVDRKLSPGLANAYIELTNRCNFHCDFCPSDLQRRQQGFMCLDLAKRLYDEVADSNLADRVELHLMGEPTLYPHLTECLQYGAAKRIRTFLTTNGSTLTAKTIPRILETLQGHLTISLQTPTQESFRHRGNVSPKWDKYIGNIRLLVREYLKRIERKQVIHHTLAIRVMITRDSKLPAKIIETFDDIRGVLSEWYAFVADLEREFGLSVFPRSELLNDRSVGEERQMTFPLQQGLSLTFWQGFTFANSVVDKSYALEPAAEARFCIRPFIDAAVLSDGNVTLCCLDYDGRLTVGNVLGRSLRSILDGEPAMKLRAAMLGHEALPPTCRQCQASVKPK